MKIQRKPFWCGPASIANALEVLGVKTTQGEVAKRCHVDAASGCSEEEIKRGLLSYGVEVDETALHDPTLADLWLWRQVTHYGPAILCVDSWEHWVAVIGSCRDRYAVFDPSLGAGLKIYRRDGLLTRWRTEKSYYSIGVSEAGQ